MSIKRIVCHFSCGAASTVATKLAIEKYRNSGIPIVILNIFLHREHPDNARYLGDCEKWFGIPITVIRDEKYNADPHEVWRRVRYIVNPTGAACTRVLKRELGAAYWRPGDLDVFGFTADEAHRLDDFIDANAHRNACAPLIESSISKAAALAEVKGAGLELPVMYRLGYRNNNCIGCPKGGAGYWNKIRVDFPEVFEDVAWIEEMLGARISQVQKNGVRRRVTLNELPPDAGRYEAEPDISCSYVCTWPAATEEDEL